MPQAWPGGAPAEKLEQLLAGPPDGDPGSGLMCYLPLLVGRQVAELTDGVLAGVGIGKIFHRRRICKWVGSLVELPSPAAAPAAAVAAVAAPSSSSVLEPAAECQEEPVAVPEAGWSVKQLKRAIERNGGSWAGLTEKAELVQQAVELRTAEGRVSVPPRRALYPTQSPQLAVRARAGASRMAGMHEAIAADF